MINIYASVYGVKQGDCLSPTLFGIYINDLVADLNNAGYGISIGNRTVNCLLYADDLALKAGNERDIQAMLDIVHTWCRKWRIKINCGKSHLVHYRRPAVARSEVNFHIGPQCIETVAQYKYLGIILDEFLDFSVTSEVLAGAAGRALGAIVARHRQVNDLNYSTYRTVYHA